MKGGTKIHKTWQSVYRNGESEAVRRRHLSRIVDKLCLTPDISILDAGCGTAFNAVLLAKLGLNVDGVDFSSFAIEQGCRHAEANGVAGRVRLRHGDLTALDIPSNSYDAVLCLGVLMHIPDLESAIDELVRVVKPGGMLLIGESNRGSPEYLLSRIYWRMRNGRITVEPHSGYTNVWFADGDKRLLSRKFSMRWLADRLKSSGMAPLWRSSGDLTETYTRTSRRWLQNAIHRANAAWFHLRGPAAFAVGNYLAFRKSLPEGQRVRAPTAQGS